jgi:hypothetical protein
MGSYEVREEGGIFLVIDPATRATVFSGTKPRVEDFLDAHDHLRTAYHRRRNAYDASSEGEFQIPI